MGYEITRVFEEMLTDVETTVTLLGTLAVTAICTFALGIVAYAAVKRKK